jgi:hypothetical protein
VPASGSIAVSPSATTLYAITKTASCGSDSRTTTININPTPAITSFTAPASVAPGASGTISFAYTNGTSYSFTSSLGNTFTPSGGASTNGSTVAYSRDVAAGPDTIMLTVDGPCGTTTDTRVIADPSPVITSFSVPPSVASGASGTITFTYTSGTSYLITSSLGNAINPPSGTSSSGGSSMYFRDFEFGPDTITLTVTGPGGNTSASRVINDPSPTASVFTISPSTVQAGGHATINFTIADTTSWSIFSALGNGFSQTSGSGSGSFSVTYTASNATGTDTVTLGLVGPGGSRNYELHPVVTN